MATGVSITVTVGPWAKDYMTTPKTLVLGADATVLDAILATSIPEDQVGFGVVDGLALPKEAPLTDGITLELFPVIVGG